MRSTTAKSSEKHRHATSGTHAERHGVLIGSLRVLDELPPKLAQGMFASLATFEVVLRLASDPGRIDAASTPTACSASDRGGPERPPAAGLDQSHLTTDLRGARSLAPRDERRRAH